MWVSITELATVSIANPYSTESQYFQAILDAAPQILDLSRQYEQKTRFGDMQVSEELLKLCDDKPSMYFMSNLMQNALIIYTELRQDSGIYGMLKRKDSILPYLTWREEFLNRHANTQDEKIRKLVEIVG